MTCAQHAAHNPKFEKMRLFTHPWWQHLDYRVKVATTQENKPPTQGTRQWTFTTPRWRCGSILLPLWARGPQHLGSDSKEKVHHVQRQSLKITRERWIFCLTAFDCSRLGYSDNDQVSGLVEFENFMNLIHVYYL